MVIENIKHRKKAKLLCLEYPMNARNIFLFQQKEKLQTISEKNYKSPDEITKLSDTRGHKKVKKVSYKSKRKN